MNLRSDQNLDDGLGATPNAACQAAASAANDLGNLLTVIVGYSHLALSGVDPASPTAEFLREIHAAAETGVDLMDRIRALGDEKAPPEEPRPDAPDDVASTTDDPEEPGRILVVEDDFLVRRTACLLLLDAGFEVLEAEHPAAVLALPAEELDRVSLVLTDMMMPGMTGREMMRRLQADHPSLRAVYMSGIPQSHLVASGQLEAELPMLEKPFGEEILTRCVRRVLAA